MSEPFARGKFLLAVIGTATALLGASTPIIFHIIDTRVAIARSNIEATLASVLRFNVDFMEHWPEVRGMIDDVAKDTGVDRVLLLRAWGALGHPERVTAFIQIHEGHPPLYKYDEFPIDDDYRKRLSDVILLDGSPHYIDVQNIPPSLIKGVYDNEGIFHSLWYLIRHVPEEDGEASIYFCSVSTESGEPFTELEKTRIGILMSHIKKLYNLEA